MNSVHLNQVNQMSKFMIAIQLVRHDPSNFKGGLFSANLLDHELTGANRLTIHYFFIQLFAIYY